MEKSLSLSPSLTPGQSGKFASELKFVVPVALADEIRAWARLNMEADPHGTGEHGDLYNISSIYLDTENYDVLQRNGSFGRSKYRIRRYESGTGLYLERKIKNRGLVSKKRLKVELEALPLLSKEEAVETDATYWFHRRILARQLRPVCQIAYERTARMAKTPTGLIRLTLDEHVATAPVSGFAFPTTGQPEPLPVGGLILELKFRQQTPKLFAECMERFHLVRQSASKYRLACAKLGLGISTVIAA